MLRFIRYLTLIIFVPIATEAQILSYDTDIEVSLGKRVAETSFLVEIDNRQSSWLGEVSIRYSQDDEVDIEEAAIVNESGKVLRSLTKKEIVTRHDISQGAFFEDDWVKQFALTWHQYPYRIRYKYRVITKRFIYACNWAPLYYYNVPVLSASLRVSFPKSYGVIVWRPTEPAPDSTRSGDRISMFWKFKDVPVIRKEEFQTPQFDLLPRITIAPKKFIYGIDGSLDSWTSYGNWLDQLNTGTTDLPVLEKLKVKELTKNAGNQTEVIRTLYHYLQDNTRYLNISIDEGGLKSYPASYVTAKKYGDCKALTTYMKAMLEEVGIRSFAVSVNGDDNPNRVNLNIPGPQFNHRILCVPVGKDTIWIENTANHLPFGYLGTFTQNRPALVVNGSQSRIVRTPAMSDESVYCKESYSCRLEKDGPGSASAIWELRGDRFEQLRNLQSNLKDSDVKGALDRSLPGKDFQITKWTVSQASRDTPSLTVHLDLEIRQSFRDLGSALALKPPAFNPWDVEQPARRTTPVRIYAPVVESQTFTYDLAALGEMKVTLPQDVEVRADFAVYTSQYRHEGAVINVERKLVVHPVELPLSAYSNFYNFVSAIRESDRNSTILLTR